MQATGLAEDVLAGARPLGQRLDQSGRYRERGIDSRGTQHALDRGERGVAADATARGRIEVALQPIGIVRGAIGELDAHDIADRATDAAVGDVFPRADDAFAVQESDRKLDVLAGRAHGDRHGGARPGFAGLGDADLERLFHHDQVLARLSRSSRMASIETSRTGLSCRCAFISKRSVWH